MNPEISAQRVRLDPRDPVLQRPLSRLSPRSAPRRPSSSGRITASGASRPTPTSRRLLRDRRFGRQILHVMSREELGWPPPKPHLAPFDALERHSMLELEPPEHTRLRKLVNRAFVSRQVEKLDPRIAALANALIDAFEAPAAADLIEAFATPIPVAVIAELHRRAGRTWGRGCSTGRIAWWRCTSSASTRAVEDSAGAARANSPLLCAATSPSAARDLRDDLISQLIVAESDGGGSARTNSSRPASCCSTPATRRPCTASATREGVLEQARPAEAFATTARAATVEELLRFDAPLHLFTRYALEDLEYDGVALQQGDKIGLLLGAANRDPLRFPNPTVRPARANPHVAFGGGIHFCVGAPLARLECVALPILFRRLPGSARRAAALSRRLSFSRAGGA